jgi:hypothetical protein
MGTAVTPNDVFVTMKGWRGYCHGRNEAWLAVLVRTTKTAEVLRIRIMSREDVFEVLDKESDKRLTIAH